MAKTLDLTVALLTPTEYREFKGVPEDNQSLNDGLLAPHINAGSLFVARHCGRLFITPKSGVTPVPIVEQFTGRDTVRRYTAQAPILASPAIVVEYSDGSTWTAVSSDDYDLDLAEGCVTLINGLSYSQNFSVPRNWRFTYAYGYDITTIPADLKLAVFKLVQRHLKLVVDDLEGETSRSFGETSTNYNLQDLTAELRQLLAPFRRVVL